MEKIRLGEEEIIYNIKIGKEEALGLLLFACEKKMIYEIQKYEMVFTKIGYFYEDELRLIDSVVYSALNYFVYHNASFNHYLKNVLKRTIIDIYRENLKANSTSITYDSDLVEMRLCDDSHKIDEKANYQLLLKALKDENEEYYQIALFLLEGYSYEEIAQKLNTNKKHLSYLIQKIRKKFKNLYL